MGFKTIDELFKAWEEETENSLYQLLCKAYRAGHLQGCNDSLDLLKRAHDAVTSGKHYLGFSECLDLLTDLEDQIGYIEEQTKEQQ